MNRPLVIDVSVVFLSTEDGGRLHPAVDDQRYRPHVVVGDPGQRVAITADDNRTITEDYLAVCFSGQGELLTPGQSHDVRLRLLYYPYGGYDALVTGATFTIREGAKVVGSGCVSRGVEYAAT